jgi:ribosomal protein L24E
MKCKQCSKSITKLTNKFYRQYGTAISYVPKTGKIEEGLAFCSMKCLEKYKKEKSNLKYVWGNIK